ncbi:hypothetical protein GTQ34_06995 [Muricauda sp. JGD-17]|uniref:Uncharacterized protein n=1 Tax=Flagellimonas ochracea TaxID=2696472 RepID=A0A964WXJ3_9FLAO|nr:hypothetical protein [Allomuricauda ochracea]NAY91659.1 hypothetical protein [Allomuricauda ochracea]
MADQPVNQNTSDEIDLGQLFQMIGRGVNKLGNFFLRVFLYLKKNAIILISLAIIGALIGFGLKFISEEKQQLDVIVKPNLESKDYLYDIVDEIAVNLKDKNESFFNEMGIAIDDTKGFEISIEPVKEDAKTADMELEYLEVLQKFEDTDLIADVLREELLKNTELHHRITFFYKSEKGNVVAQKLMEYINSNAYFNELISIQTKNALETIERNESSIAQIDTLIAEYTRSMKTNSQSSEVGKIVLENEDELNVGALLNLKNRMIQEIQTKRMELKAQSATLSIVNFGKPHKSIKPLFGKKIVLIPTILVSLFFVLSFLRYLNRKALELEKG